MMAASEEQPGAMHDVVIEDESPLEKSASTSDKKPRKKRSRTRRVGSFFWSIFMIMVFIGLGLFAGGLVRYTQVVTQVPTPLSVKADGIIVLTGGEQRLATGVQLLENQLGKRLLITGVNRNISDENIKKLTGANKDTIACCIEIDRVARDTVGNALAAKRWVKKHSVKTLIVVTGAFHMPRAVKELSHTLEGVSIYRRPVNVPTDKNWWHDANRVRDLLREYMKLLIVSGRDVLNEAMGWPWPTMPLRDALARAEHSPA